MKKFDATKILQESSETFLYQNNSDSNSDKFSCEFAFILCLPFWRNKKGISF